MMRKFILATAVAVTAALAAPTPSLAQHHGGGHGVARGGVYRGGVYRGGVYRGGVYRGGYGGYGGYGGRGRYWGGRWWGYGIGPCWRYNPFYGSYVWVCY